MIIANVSDFFHHLFQDPSELFDPEKLVKYGGLAVLIILSFAQTGIFFCFFLPGDAILFTAGVFISTGDFHQNIFVLCASLTAATFLGNMTGYYIGKIAGPMIQKRKDTWFFKKKYLDDAKSFYERYGVYAISIGMFFFIIRAFAPVVAGIIGLRTKQMIVYSFIGAFVWVNLLVLAGYFLGRIPFVEEYLEYFVIAMLVSILFPVALRLLLKKRKSV